MTPSPFDTLCTEAGAHKVAVRVSLIRTIEGAQNLLRISLWQGDVKLDQGEVVPAGRDIDNQARWLLGRLRQHLGPGEAA